MTRRLGLAGVLRRSRATMGKGGDKVVRKKKMNNATRKGTVKTYGNKWKLNAKFKKAAGLAYSRARNDAEANTLLKRLQQPAYLEIARMTQKKAKSFLEAWGVLAPKYQEFLCWVCGSKLTATNDEDRVVLR